MYPFAILIGGPTASNKTELAFEIQSKFPSFIVNADSMQVYDKLKTLTNVPEKRNLMQHSCNLFEFINYPEKCNVGFWLDSVQNVLSTLKNKTPIFVGGTGMYLDSLLGNISPIPEIPERIKLKVEQLHEKFGNLYFYNKLKKVDENYSKIISCNDTQRLVRAISIKVATGRNISYWHNKQSKKLFNKILYVVIENDREKLYENINKRCLKILKSNVIEEVSVFLKQKSKISHPLHKSIGLNVLEKHINGLYSLKETIEFFSQETRRYAKRQITWFKNKSTGSLKLNFKEAKKYLLKNF